MKNITLLIKEYFAANYNGKVFHFKGWNNEYHKLECKGNVFFIDGKLITESEDAIFAVAYSRLFY